MCYFPTFFYVYIETIYFHCFCTLLTQFIAGLWSALLQANKFSLTPFSSAIRSILHSQSHLIRVRAGSYFLKTTLLNPKDTHVGKWKELLRLNTVLLTHRGGSYPSAQCPGRLWWAPCPCPGPPQHEVFPLWDESPYCSSGLLTQ